MAEESGVWVYAVADEVPGGRLARLTGVAGEPLRTVQGAGLTAVVGDVDLAEYGEEPLRQNLEDLDWLEAKARAHHRVVHAVASHAPAVPMRLATVYHDDARVAEMLTELAEPLTEGLNRVRGKVEYGVKGYAETPTPTQERATVAASQESPGTAYLRRRRADLAARDAEREAAINDAEQVHRKLTALSAASRRHAPQHPSLSGQQTPMLLNGAYLVAADRITDFTDAVTRLDAEHRAIRLELTGPWPPYSFAAIEED